MSEFVIDRRALGLHPDWENILLEIIDLELYGLNPRRRFILGYILMGYSQRETAELMGLHKRQVQREIYHIRHRKARK